MKNSIQFNKGFGTRPVLVIVAIVLVIGAIIYFDSSKGTTIVSPDQVVEMSTTTVSTSTTTPVIPVKNPAKTASSTNITVDPKTWVSYTGRYVGSDDITFKMITDKREYTAQESIQITLEVSNNSGETQTLKFPTSCQGNYTIVSTGVQQTIVFDSAKNTACSTYENSVSIPAHSSQKIKLAHEPSVYKLSPGKYAVVGTVIGYGEASAPITITN